MDSISALQTENLGGLVKLYYLPVDLATGETLVDVNEVTTVIRRGPDEPFYEADVTMETKKFLEDHDPGPEGGIYKHKVTAFAPGDSLALLQLLDEMVTQRFLVVIEDNLDHARLVGTKLMGMSFTYKYNTGASIRNLKGYQLTFTLESLDPAPVYPFDPSAP